MSSTALHAPEIKLPPGSRLPRALQMAAYLTMARPLMQRYSDRFGTVFSMHIPGFGPAVVISDPGLAKQFFQYPADAVHAVEPNLSAVIGPGSTFGLQGDEHKRRRKLLVPPFRGHRMRVYDSLLEEETLAATANWVDGEEFPVIPTMMTIGLNTILRAVFGARGDELDALRPLVPHTVDAASRLAMVPWLHRDFGRFSPWRRYLAKREAMYAVLDQVIQRALDDPELPERQDVLALLLQTVDEDGVAMDRRVIAEELLTLVGAGHETTATTVSWAIERLRRHPEVLARLVAELDAGQTAYLDATVQEVLRVRPPIDAVARRVVAPSITLGPWVIPRDYTVVVGIGLSHLNDASFEDAATFDPGRFLANAPNPYAWVPFGGGVRRCPGAAFAHMEVGVILRTLLREFELVPTGAPAERWKSRGVAFAPAGGGLLSVRRRPGLQSRDAGVSAAARSDPELPREL
jgi:cytochrome P450